MPKWFRTFLVPMALLALVAAACGEEDGDVPPANGDEVECNADLNVGVAYDVGGRGDKSFNDAATAGVTAAVDEGLVCEENVTYIEPDATGSNRDENVLALAEDGNELVVAVGFAFSEGINETAGDFPDTHFAIIDGFATCGTVCGLANDDLTNVTDLTFKEHEGSFLVGAVAAIQAGKDGCDTVGFLGGQTGPLIEKFEAGYIAGVAHIDESIEVLSEYIGPDVTAFNDAVRGEALSTDMYDAGACIIYHAAGASGAGLFNAAVEADQLAIGVDSDQYLLVSPEQQPHILTSMLKRVDTAAHDAIQQEGDGTIEPGAQVFGMEEGGVDYSKSNTDLMTEDITSEVDELKQMIIDGEITVPETP
ncbi:MAG TPA: BMP family ABC transporter substrate-binding protein [Actinomycetota bacterium]|nr:BMP family ABC transporter substrate-binding protein [Actinomycetota bacterium]